jgi:hypothetical protein
VLGLTLSKILVTLLIIVAIWKGFAMVNRLASERQAAVKRRAAGNAAHPAGRAGRPKTVELRACPRCGAYVDLREGCPCGARSGEGRRA